jgi:hypothetical protein
MEPPTPDFFKRRLSSWFVSSDRHPEDQIVFYFSGHGEVGKYERHYLILADPVAERPSGTGFETAALPSAFRLPYNGLRFSCGLVLIRQIDQSDNTPSRLNLVFIIVAVQIAY